ncbi:hypothetical protein ANO14919_058190 [Xylariales sp. No.14919]|nr:hypothetical protein ANO14919_058190 [Xylariales sp. No.14919]
MGQGTLTDRSESCQGCRQQRWRTPMARSQGLQSGHVEMFIRPKDA